MNINIKEIPNKIGVYIFKDENKKILYVGKAIDLRTRIKQHLRSKNWKIKDLMEKVKYIEFLTLDSEAEALLKEAELIKKLNPEYNYLLKDDTQYFYVCFTKEKYPKIFITHQPQKYNCDYIGPFTEGSAIRKILKSIREVIPYCTCLKEHSYNCINSMLGFCYGWCCKKNEKGDEKLYKKNIKKIKTILTGDLKKLKERLLEKLENAIKENNLDLGLKIKKEISAINKIISHTNLIKESPYTFNIRTLRKLKELLGLKKTPYLIEAYDIAHFAGTYKVGVRILFRDGKYDKSELRRFKIKTVTNPDDPRMIYEVLNRRLKHKEWCTPDLILIDGGLNQFNQALKSLEENNLDKYIKIISLSKPKSLIYYSKYKKPIPIEKIPKDLRNFIKLINKKAHSEVLKYHRKLREKIR